MAISWSFSYNSFVKFNVRKIWEPHHDCIISKSVLLWVCYKRTALLFSMTNIKYLISNNFLECEEIFRVLHTIRVFFNTDTGMFLRFVVCSIKPLYFCFFHQTVRLGCVHISIMFVCVCWERGRGMWRDWRFFYQMAHFSEGFMGEPTGQSKALAKYFEFAIGPSTLKKK